MKIDLKTTKISDLNTLFVFQQDSDANFMAAFTSENPNDKEAYLKKWGGIVKNPKINMQTVFYNNLIIGSVIHFDMGNETNVSYWFDKKYWGKGIATKALTQFIEKAKKRPLFAQVANDNIGSQKVLQKTGFLKIREEEGFANARGKVITEYVYQLEK